MKNWVRTFSRGFLPFTNENGSGRFSPQVCLQRIPQRIQVRGGAAGRGRMYDSTLEFTRFRLKHIDTTGDDGQENKYKHIFYSKFKFHIQSHFYAHAKQLISQTIGSKSKISCEGKFCFVYTLCAKFELKLAAQVCRQLPPGPYGAAGK